MGLFKELEGDVAVIVDKGMYMQVPLYTRNGYLFAKIGSKFVRLMADGSSSRPSTRIDELSIEVPLFKDGMGRLTVDGAVGKPLSASAQQTLLGIGHG